jgi:cytochrome P450
MDPKRNPNPRKFDPTRFKDNLVTELRSAQSADVSKRNNFVFGAGRRLCQGMHIAERSLFLGISRMLWGFDFSKPLDENGQPITPDIEDLRGGASRTLSNHLPWHSWLKSYDCKPVSA